MVSCREDNARVLDDENDAMMHRPTSHELHTLAMLYIGNGGFSGEEKRMKSIANLKSFLFNPNVRLYPP